MSNRARVQTYRDYRIVDVFPAPGPPMCRRILDLWTRNGILPRGARAEERLRQVVLVALDPAGRAVGVNTVYPGRFGPPGRQRPFLFYRMFIEDGAHAFHMMRFMTMEAYHALNRRWIEGRLHPYHGLVIETENAKLMRPGMVRLFEREGWTPLGRNPRGQDVWRRDFAAPARSVTGSRATTRQTP